MQFEWDEKKRLVNVHKHAIDFCDAVEIFDGDTVTMVDDRFEYEKERFIAFGLLREHVIQVVYTEREGVTRLISARKATKYEQITYFQRING